MDEFIREVDEEYRRHQIAEIWRRYGVLIVAFAVLVVVGIAGWRYWEYRKVQEAEVAAIRFAAASDLATADKPKEAEAAFEAIAADAPGGYRILARLRAAAEEGAADAGAGATKFDAIAADASVPSGLQGLARLRAGALRLDSDPGRGLSELERVAAPSDPWRHTARELLGLQALKRGDLDAAGRWFDQIAADRDTPAGLRGRLEIYTALVAGGPVQPTQ